MKENDAMRHITVLSTFCRNVPVLLCLSIMVGLAGAQSINAMYAGQTFSSSSTVYINPCNTLATGQGNTGIDCVDSSLQPVASVNFPTPDLSFQIAAPYNTAAYTIEWSITVDYTDKYGKFNSYFAQATGEDGVPGNQAWTVPWSFGPAGGTAMVDATVYFQCNPPREVGSTTYFPFTIWGANPSKSDPYNSTGDSNLILLSSAWYNATGGNPPWFATQIMTLESDKTDDQFCTPAEASLSKCSYTPGTPRWGSPDGTGVTQVDYKPNPQFWNSGYYPYWDYVVNIQDGWQVLSGDESYAQAEWANEIATMCSHFSESPDGNGGCVGGKEQSYVATNTNSRSYPKPVCTNAETAGSNEPVEIEFPQPLHTVGGVVANTSQHYEGGLFVTWSTTSNSWSQTTDPYVFVVCNETPYYSPPQ